MAAPQLQPYPKACRRLQPYVYSRSDPDDWSREPLRAPDTLVRAQFHQRPQVAAWFLSNPRESYVHFQGRCLASYISRGAAAAGHSLPYSLSPLQVALRADEFAPARERGCVECDTALEIGGAGSSCPRCHCFLCPRCFYPHLSSSSCLTPAPSPLAPLIDATSSSSSSSSLSAIAPSNLPRPLAALPRRAPWLLNSDGSTPTPLHLKQQAQILRGEAPPEGSVRSITWGPPRLLRPCPPEEWPAYVEAGFQQAWARQPGLMLPAPRPWHGDPPGFGVPPQRPRGPSRSRSPRR